MLGIVEAVGVGKVGVLTAQLLRLGVHLVHEGIHGSGHRLRQDVAGLVGGDHQHTVEQVLHRHGLSGLDAGGEAGHGGLRGGDGLV